MQVYLVQHGLAMSKEEDASRPLSATGREEVERVAQAAAAAGVRPDLIRLSQGDVKGVAYYELDREPPSRVPALD